MHKAVDTIPRQHDTWADKWSCGPNSAAKAIHMFGGDMTRNYFLNTFLEEAPNGYKTQTNIGKNIAVTGYVVGVGSILLAPFTGGASAAVFVAGWGTGVAGAITVATAAPGGVPIRNLAREISNYLPGTKHARYHDYDDWNECANAIRDDIQRGDPVIITQTFRPKKGHYLNVVGVKVDKNNHPVAFILLETDNYLYSLSAEDMEHFMERRYMGFVKHSSPKNYHIVRFYR